MNQMSAHLSFRADINGLRAWAVAAVVLYHFGIWGFGAGFIGVDIFFVISGFLMTHLICQGLKKSGRNYSIAKFYMARVRRIMPALIVMCIFLLVMGWWMLPPPDYKRLGDHVALSLIFISNFKYLNESGYFDAEAHEKWLLHTWSLSVEWQFYLLFPLFLLLVWRIQPRISSLKIAIIFFGLLSLVYCLYKTPLDSTHAFYLLNSRAWEMLAGALCAIYKSEGIILPIRKAIAESAGFLFLVGSLVFTQASDPWPGWRALLPVLGSVLILLANAKASLLTSIKPLQWLGDRSYSIYLWHWPFVVGIYYCGWHHQLGVQCAGLVLTLILGMASYRWVEQGSRHYLSHFPEKYGLRVILAVAGLTFIWAGVVIWEKGWSGRIDSRSELAAAEAMNKNPRYKQCHTEAGISSPDCMYGGTQLRAIVLGDSHANAVITAVADAATTVDKSAGVLEWTYSACPVLKGVQINFGLLPQSHQCGNYISSLLERLKYEHLGVPVIIINRWAQYAYGRNESLKEVGQPWVNFGQTADEATPEFLTEFTSHMIRTACEIGKTRKVYMVKPIPEMGMNVPQKVARSFIWGGEVDVKIPLPDYMKRQNRILDALNRAHSECGIEILDPLPYLCWDQFCHGAWMGRPLYHDDDHLSEYGNRRLTPIFAPIFQSVVKSPSEK